ncbi:MAG TPA: HDIG domain-containing protein [Leptolyngbyaceae cyanobacterium M65_K2018_010]|nr:HDIG domain-containing protein [Leptolyngbyaceae cyanobacterium M65_K2018_010]
MRAIQDLVAAFERWYLATPTSTSGRARKSISAPVHRDDLAPAGLAPQPATPAPNVPSARFWLDRQDLFPFRGQRRQRGVQHPRLAFTLTVLTLTGLLGQRFYNQPGLQVGGVAPETIYAPAQATVEDQETTEERRRDARSGALRMLKVDTTVNDGVLRSLNNLTAQLTSLRQEAGPFPFVPTSTLSTPVQAYLRRSEDAAWLKLRSLIAPLVNGEADFGGPRGRLRLEDLIQAQALLPEQQKTLSELWNYHQRTSTADLAALLTAIERSRQGYQQAAANLALLGQQVNGLTEAPGLFELSPSEWLDTQANLRRVAERMLAQGVPPGLPPEVLHRAIQLQVKGGIPRSVEDLSSRLLLTVLQPNLVEDSERTRLQAEMAAEAVKPVMVEISQAEAIVVAGEAITQSDFVLLDHFNLSQRRFNYWGLALYGGLVSGGVGLFLLVEHWHSPHLRQQDYLLLTAMVVSTGLLKMFGAAAYGLPAIGLLAGNFYGPVLGGTLVALLAVLVPMGAPVNGISFMAGAAGAMVCSVLAGRMRSREELALLGGGIGLTQGVAYLLLTVMVSPVSLVSAWSGILTGAAIQGIYGVLSSVAALGLSPYLEHAFDLITPVRLAELSNPNRPMLKRLAAEAPGTFQHTLFVASLAEAAARALGCNVELVRAGTLYHDIGKMHDPLGFIENQMGGPNKHDELKDPWLSAAIIKKHVTEGLVMARKCRLPKALQAFIPEHQGTMLISYFHHQAQEMAQADASIQVREADFRYDGPIPQSPETGIVMLADSCEAALRSLTEATPDEALAMVNRILRARWKDNQLIDSGLTREHLTVIADIFVKVWQQYNHKRIAYPKAVLPPKLD